MINTTDKSQLKKDVIKKLKNFISDLCNFLHQSKSHNPSISNHIFSGLKTFIDELLTKDVQRELHIELELKPTIITVKNSYWKIIIEIIKSQTIRVQFNFQNKTIFNITIPSNIDSSKLLDYFWNEFTEKIPKNENEYFTYDKDNDQVIIHTQNFGQIFLKYDNEKRQIFLNWPSGDNQNEQQNEYSNNVQDAPDSLPTR